MPSNLSQRFEDWSRIVEARFGAWPTWKKLVVFTPVLILLSAVLWMVLGLIGTGIQGLAHH